MTEKGAEATIYLVTNTVNGKTYVGVTSQSLCTRFSAHKWVAAHTQDRSHLHRAMRKHGPDAFVVESIASVLRAGDGSAVERQLIKQLRPEYNLTNGGEFTVGKRATPETIEKIRAGNLGKVRTPEQRAAMSACKKAQYASRLDLKEKTARALEKARGVIDRDRQKAVAASVARARVWSAESRAKLSASCVGRHHSQDVIDKVRQKNFKAVRCLSTGEVYRSVSEAAEKTGASISGVSRVARGDRAQVNGLQFEFVTS